MSCTITSGINALNCYESNGGIFSVYIGNHANLSSITQSDSYTTAVVMSSGTGTYLFKPTKMTSSWEEVGGTNENGTVSYVQTLTMNFSVREAAQINTFKLMAKSDLFAFVVENGTDKNSYFLGQENGLRTQVTKNSGVNVSDSNGYQVVLTSWAETSPATEITYSAVTATVL